jgi:fructose-specific phosphotransferase system IIC component
MESAAHTEPDWGVRLGVAALAIGGLLAFTQSGIPWAVLFGIPVGLTVVIWISRRALLDRALQKPVTRSRKVLRSACVALTVTGVAVWLWYRTHPKSLISGRTG